MSPGPSGMLRPADATAIPAPPDEPSRSEPPHRARSTLRELSVVVAIAIALALLLKAFVVQPFVIDSVSMLPTIEPGDRVLVAKMFDEPSRGDVIVFGDPNGDGGFDRGVWGGFTHRLSETFGFARPEDDDFIKRVVGLPGEVIEIRRHVVYVNGSELAEPYLTDQARAAMADFGPVEVPRDALFVMGDNRGNSSDSRSALGFVPLDVVIGRAFVIVWPPSRLGWLR